jgi:hypothetical protein
MSRQISRLRWTLGLTLACSFVLTACSDLYLDRRETVSFGAGDAVASDAALQTIDPWPPASANRDVRSNGPRMAGAIERYRTGKVIQPQGLGTSSYSGGNSTSQGGGPTSGGSGSQSNSGN